MNITRLNKYENIMFIDFIMEKDYAIIVLEHILKGHAEILNNKLTNNSYILKCKCGNSIFQMRIHFDNKGYSTKVSLNSKTPEEIIDLMRCFDRITKFKCSA